MIDTYKKNIEEIYKELDSSKKGLSSNKVRSLIKINGKNELIEKDKKTKSVHAVYGLFLFAVLFRMIGRSTGSFYEF